MKRLLVILLFAAAGVVAACSPGATSTSGVSSPAVSIEAPSVGASALPSEQVSAAPSTSQ